VRILLLSSVEHDSGSALRFRALAGALARRGHEVHLLEPAAPGSRPETPEGVLRHPCPRLPVRVEWQAALWLLHGLATVRRLRPEICWSMKALPNAWIPAKHARELGAHVAADLDDLDEEYYEAGVVRRVVAGSFREAAASADDVTTHSEPLRARIAALRGGRSAPVFVDQPVDVARFAGASAPPGLRERLGLSHGPVLLYAGHLGPASDLAQLLPALRVVAVERSEARVLVVGDGRNRAALEEVAARDLPRGFVRFAGPVPHRDVAGYYALGDVALNYLEDNEANRHRASIKVREALAAGLPVVTSRTPDSERFAEFVRFPQAPGPTAFAAAVMRELDAPDRAAAARGAAWLAAHGTADVAVRRIAERWEARA
jgi:glycosyltransferase involved in cell wall biosynthesis